MMRYVVYARSPFPWETQFAAVEPLTMVRVLVQTNDLPTATLAATLWADWMNDYGLVFDTQSRQWAKVVPPSLLDPAGVQISLQVLHPPGQS